ncbi:hypothetical protein LTR84_011627 [Exophiala bonariae]|uniref:RING-type domain-containing protein n=1 Tax=Exophiala bonariae TaxID=1690606 RepID=A0AAV9NH03_9EURO|nr:hypothetical protein LTR84_011627 [Exophiala bonariae]
MSVSDFGVVAIVIPNPEYDNSNGARIVTDAFGFSLRASGVIRTLSANNPQRWNVIQGLLYYPELPDDTPCSNATQSLAPANVTTRAQVPLGNYPLIAVAPWTDPACVQSYLEVMRFDNARGAIFFHPDNSSDRPPPVSDQSWSLEDGGRWKSDNQFPIYALPGMLGVYMLEELAQYSGNMSSAPYGNELVQLYNPNDTVRLYTRMDISQSSGIPSLWVFLIIVLAILLAVVLITSILMHCVQRRQRRALQRRVAAGEVDLEALGIKRLNVPQDQLDKMPQYVFTSKAEGTTGTTETVENSAKTGANDMTPVVSAPREVQFTQATCPICLDDFVNGETTVRELPCNHIFHPECIDPFLRDNSSLCPMCKKSALPAGYCPVVVTNLMVRRERLVRRMRERRIAAALPPESNPTTGSTPISAIRNTVRRFSTAPNNRPPPNSSASGAHGTASELQPVTRLRSTQIDDDMPADVRSQGITARRAWRRERLARQQAQNYDQQANEARTADVSRPLWRRIVGRFIPRYE